jgi:hypothetical protein
MPARIQDIVNARDANNMVILFLLKTVSVVLWIKMIIVRGIVYRKKYDL